MIVHSSNNETDDKDAENSKNSRFTAVIHVPYLATFMGYNENDILLVFRNIFTPFNGGFVREILRRFPFTNNKWDINTFFPNNGSELGDVCVTLPKK